MSWVRGVVSILIASALCGPLSGAVFLWCWIGPLVGDLQAQPRERSAAESLPSLSKLGPHSAVSVVDLATGKALVSHRDRVPLKPASVLKVLTASVALRELGPEYRFLTEVFGGSGSALPVLSIRGRGAPDFTIEQLWLLARELRARGIERIDEVLLDASLFEVAKNRKSQRAYAAGTSALSFNYNSLTFVVCPSRAGAPASVVVDPLELSVELRGRISTGDGKGGFHINERASGVFDISGIIAPGAACTRVYRSVEDPVRYLGSVLPRVFRDVGIDVKRGARPGVVPANAPLLTRVFSRPLSQLVEDLNHFSNNFVAEQLLTVLSGAAPFSRERGLLELERYLLRLDIPDSEFTLFDGSGLSHDNRLSARALTAVLVESYERIDVHPELVSSLPIADRSGTLRNRRFLIPEARVRAKTGTLNGVSTIAGYLTSRSGRRLAFSLLQNESPDRVAALRREEQLLREIAQHF